VSVALAEREYLETLVAEQEALLADKDRQLRESRGGDAPAAPAAPAAGAAPPLRETVTAHVPGPGSVVIDFDEGPRGSDRGAAAPAVSAGGGSVRVTYSPEGAAAGGAGPPSREAMPPPPPRAPAERVPSSRALARELSFNSGVLSEAPESAPESARASPSRMSPVQQRAVARIQDAVLGALGDPGAPPAEAARRALESLSLDAGGRGEYTLPDASLLEPRRAGGGGGGAWGGAGLAAPRRRSPLRGAPAGSAAHRATAELLASSRGKMEHVRRLLDDARRREPPRGRRPAPPASPAGPAPGPGRAPPSPTPVTDSVLESGASPSRPIARRAEAGVAPRSPSQRLVGVDMRRDAPRGAVPDILESGFEGAGSPAAPGVAPPAPHPSPPRSPAAARAVAEFDRGYRGFSASVERTSLAAGAGSPGGRPGAGSRALGLAGTGIASQSVLGALTTPRRPGGPSAGLGLGAFATPLSARVAGRRTAMSAGAGHLSVSRSHSRLRAIQDTLAEIRSPVRSVRRGY